MAHTTRDSPNDPVCKRTPFRETAAESEGRDMRLNWKIKVAMDGNSVLADIMGGDIMRGLN